MSRSWEHRYNYDDPQVQNGEALFHAAGADCHIPEFTTSDYHPLTEYAGRRSDNRSALT